MKIENEDVNAGCNIIIPTHDRPHYLQRILNYYDSFGEKFEIVVADSSSDENKKRNKRIISSVSHLDIQYIDLYPTEINPFHKFTDMVNYAKEKYCVFCADDDFVVPNGIKQSVEFLEKNPDFACAHGHYIGFWFKKDERGKQQFCWKPAYSHESITFSDPKKRLNEHLSNYTVPTFYAVHRTDLIKMVYKETLKSTVDPLLFGELLPSMLTLIYGKMKCLDMLYAARDAYSTAVGSPTMLDFIKAGTYNENYAKFRDCLAGHLSKMSQLEVEESKKVVDDAMSVYFSTYSIKKESLKTILMHKMSDILDYLRLPDWLNEGIRSLYRRIFVPQKTEKFLILSDVPPKYYDDFNKIRLHVLSYSKK